MNHQSFAATADKLFNSIQQIEEKYDLEQQKTWIESQKVLGEKSSPLSLGSLWYPVRQFVDFELTPAKARYLEDNFNVFLGQRSKTDRRKEMIATAALNNTWHGNKIVLAILGEPYQLEDGRLVNSLLLNGGNSIGACLEFGVTLKNNTFQLIYAPTMKGCSNCYYNIDRKESTRTATEMTKAVLAGEENREEWTNEQGLRSKVFKDCYTAANVVEFGPSYRSKQLSVMQKVQLSQTKYAAEMEWLKGYIFDDRKTPKFLKKVVGVLGVVMYTHLVWGDVCEMFWDDLKAGYRATPNNRMTGAKNSKRTPQETLMKFLDSPGTEDEITTFGKVMTAVNAWASGKETFTFKGNRTLDTQPILASKFAPHENCMTTDDEREIHQLD